MVHKLFFLFAAQLIKIPSVLFLENHGWLYVASLANHS